MTKAAKKRRRLKKGGRPRNKDAIRTPSGAISRGKEEQDRITAQAANENRSVAVDARMRLLKLSEEMAKTQLAGFEIGRLHLRNMRDDKDPYSINREQYEAAEQFADDMCRYYGLTGIPFPSARAMNMFAVGGYQGEESEERQKAARRASNKYMALHGALRSTVHGPKLFTIVNNVCVLDESTANWPQKQFLMLKSGLNHLHTFYRG